MTIKNPKLMIIRGLPGSGKSTLAKKLAEKYNVAHFENDQFLMHSNNYVWTPEAAKVAVQKCFMSVLNTLKSGKSCIVSNVFVTKNSIDRYVKMAKKLGVEVKVLRKTSQYKNIHDVPDEVFNSMKSSFMDYPGEELVK